MTDAESAFLAAIIAAPDDDLPRLVYADWLDEQGKAERAEFIRVQCELEKLLEDERKHTERQRKRQKTNRRARWKMFPEWGQILPIRDHARLLFGRHAENWVPVLSGRHLWCKKQDDFAVHFSERQDGSDERLVLVFSRGFGYSVTCPSAAWLAHGDAITRRHPVRVVRLTTTPSFGEDESFLIVFRNQYITRFRFADDVRTYDIRNPHPSDRREFDWRVAAISARWPGITFELPPEPRGGMTVNGQRVPIREWSVG